MATVKTKGQAQLFQNPILEFFTKTTVWESSISSIGISIFAIWLSYYFQGGITLKTGLVWFFSGLVIWSLFEYILHRYLFHIEMKGSERLQYLLHGVHHEYPNDANRTLMPFVPKAIFSILFCSFFTLVLGWLGAVFFAGFLMGYYFYSMMHYAMHRFKAPKFLQPLWKHHHLHHHLHQDAAFGVSSTLWDRIFRTMPPEYEHKTKEVRVK